MRPAPASSTVAGEFFGVVKLATLKLANQGLQQPT
jgi:hypothetical protein